MKRTVEEIERDMKKLRKEQNAIETQAFNEKVPQLRKLIGKAFAYRNNCRSCPKPNEKWDVFRKVIDIEIRDGCANAIFLECSIDHLGEVEVKIGAEYIFRLNQIPTIFHEGWDLCRMREFNRAYRLAMREIAKPTKIRATLGD